MLSSRILYAAGVHRIYKGYLQIKDNPWLNLVKLALNSEIGDEEVLELLKIANRYLPSVRLEYDRLRELLLPQVSQNIYIP